MTSENTHYDSIIVGGGLTGTSLALALASAGLKIALIDAKDYSTSLAPNDPRATALSLGSRTILERYALWDKICDNVEPLWNIRVAEGYGTSFLHFNHKTIGNDPMGYMIENTHLLQTLWKQCKEEKAIDIYVPYQWKELDITSHKAVILLNDNTKISAPLIIACDGKNSQIRSFMHTQTHHHDHKQVGMVCSIHHTYPHQGIAVERFLPTGPFAILPLKGGYMSSLVWTEPSALGEFYKNMPKNDLEDTIKQRCGEWLGDISVASSLMLYPLTLVVAKEFCASRVLYVGDAAHAIHPLAGQGFNLTLRDIDHVVMLLKKALYHGEDLGNQALLQTYSASRKGDVYKLIAATEGLNYLFLSKNMFIKKARSTGLSLFNKVNFLKKFSMKQAMGIQ